MHSYRQELIDRFREQAIFAASDSPLYQQIFVCMADWLTEEPDAADVVWLLQTVQDRAPFDVTLLLPAALHRAVLAGDSRAAELARYYPTAGGTVPEPGDGHLASILRDTIPNLREQIAPFLREATVQTNETARGLVWLWPLGQTSWQNVHLLELGASAGLNLLADRRAYRLVDSADPERPLLDMGHAPPSQFIVPTHGMADMPDAGTFVPQVSSRSGIDLRPFILHTEEDELTLASFVWGDQPVRLHRLREGIEALRSAEAQGVTLQLQAVDMPSQLPAFLKTWMPEPSELPLVVYNTTVTMYLDGKQQALREVLEEWAPSKTAPVLWLQWEPQTADLGDPPDSRLFAWTADLWQDGQHNRFHLAWVHPHATDLRWLPGATDWLDIAHSLH